MKYANIREEELKNKVAHDYFNKFDWTKIVGNIDFCISVSDVKAFLWAEAKKGKADVVKSLVQLILTIGKARTFDEYLPPAFLGVFDAEKIAFIPYSEVHDIFYVNDFNWNITPSNHETKEFRQVYEKVKATIENSSLLFAFGSDDKEIKAFIKNNFIVGKSETSKIKIDKNNFIVVYNKWLAEVKPKIAVNWDVAKKSGIIDGDFYLADLLAHENETLKEKLFVLLRRDHYELDRKIDDLGFFSSKTTSFTDRQKAHTQFWNKYERPPREVYWDYIVERRDLLVPQDIRERKGSFFTPQIWVELSQKYLADVLGEDWQDEYYIWDCAAGTGNLLAGLTNKKNIWASTIDQQDVSVIKDRIKNGANLLEKNVFQFDFLNDDFTKLPKPLHDIISNPEKRKKLVIYINPPYAESNGKVTNKRSQVQLSRIHTKYAEQLEKGGAELFAQFLIRIYCEIPNCIIGNFSKLKLISGTNSAVFRNHFLAKLKKLFVVPSFTFDNVKGQFPIGFFIWNTGENAKIKSVKADIFDENKNCVGTKRFFSCDYGKGRINDWLDIFKNKNGGEQVGFLVGDAPDFQHNNYVSIQNEKGIRHGIYFSVNQNNLLIAAVYLAVRHCPQSTWLNDRDQFLYPNDDWQRDSEFQNDCLAFTLFHGQNRITSSDHINHWIPFTEEDVDASKDFASNFMSDFIAGKIKLEKNLITAGRPRTSALKFSAQAKAVFAAGKKLWQYYHATPNYNVNASLYDIREFFQGRNAKGAMNARSDDEMYTALINNLRAQLKLLAEKIAPKVYEYGFLKK